MLLLAVVIVLGYFWCQHRGTSTREPSVITQKEHSSATGEAVRGPVDELTNESVVVPYIKRTGRLPEYYITKREAREKGWIAARGNLCDVLPGRAIGGDVFSNREKQLPVKSGRKWFEADINYHCGRRNADRVLFSDDRLVFVTKDHYQTFEEK